MAMVEALETQKERDIRARDEVLREYEGYGEMGDYVRMVEEKILDFAYDEYSQSRAGMEGRLHQWAHYVDRYRGQWKDADDDSPFADMNPPRIARMIDIHVARTLQTIIPDRSRLDFFAFGPETSYEGEPVDPLTEKYGQAAANAIRNDLINGRFVENLKKALWDLFSLGNCVLMPTWELSIQYRYAKQPNPEIANADGVTPEGLPYKWDIVDGQPVATPIQPEVTVREPYREFDAPKLRHINIRNVFPSELDKDNIEECAAVSIYDTVRLTDLLDNEISTGGFLYANLGRVMFDHEDYDTPEIADRHNGEWGKETWNNVDSAKKMDRITRIGRFRMEEVFDDLAVPEESRGEVLEILAEKYGMDRTKLTGWNTWILEMVSEGSVLVRCQPSPHMVDKKNIVHHGLFKVPNHTWAEGIYDRCHNGETVGNAMERYRMELTLQMVRPMMFVDRSAIDNTWRQMSGDNYSFSPRGVVWLKQGKRVNEAIQFPNIPTAPLQYAEIAQSQQALDMSEMGHLPPVKMGGASGGATASEVNQMGSSADIILQEFCMDIQDGLLNPSLSWLLLLHHQYTDEVRIGYELDPAGKAIMEEISPDVWTKQYRVNLLGFQQVGNLAVRTMNFNEAMKWLQSTGRLNVDTAAIEYLKLLGIQNGGNLIAPPQEPPPPLQDQVHMNFSFTPKDVGPLATAEYFRLNGANVTPEMLAQMGAIDAAIKEAAAFEASKEQAESDAQLDGYLNTTNVDGGSPGGVPEAQPSQYEGDSHHPQGEQEQRQRGLHDEKGMMNTMGQKLRSPASGRAANP